ncbi:MAG: TolC family protein [Bacteroidetes bacterium]|nr:TolC family protein [Bacteroidota bacterium]
MRFFIALLSISLLSLQGYSQVRMNNLGELLQYADTHAPSALQTKIQPKTSRQDMNAVASALYPKINAFATGDYYPIIATQVIPAEVLGGPKGTYLKAQFGLPYVFTAGGELTMPVINLEKWTQLSKAKVAYHQSQYSSKAALENIHIQLIQSYYQTLVTKQVLLLNDENVETTTELSRIMQERNKNGVVNPADYNRSRNLELDAQSAGYGYQKQLQQSMNGLNATLNLKDDSLQLTEDIAAFTWPSLNSMGDATIRAAWKEADYKLRIAELSLSESRNAGLPRMSLTARYMYNMQSKFETSNGNVDFNNANVGARIDFPIFQGNFYRSSWRKNRLLLDAAKLEQERTQATLTQQQKDWFASYTAAYNKHTVLEQKVKNASDNLRIAKLNIKEGLMEFDEFNNIFMEYNRARMEQIQNLADGILYYLLSTQNF